MYLTSGIERAVQQKGNEVATVFAGRRRTWAQVRHRVARLAAGLQMHGIAPGERVALLALNSDRYLEAVLATWWSGGVVMPLNVRWSEAEIIFALDDCDTCVLIVDDAHRQRVEAVCERVRRRPVLIHADDTDAPAGMHSFEALIASHEPIDDARRGGNDLASIMYTGGTTGLPKGVMQTHLNLWSSALHRLADLPALPGVAVLQVAPLFHMAGLGRAIMQWIAGEGQVILPAFDAGEVLRAVREEAVGELQLVPTMIQAVLDHPDFARTDFSRVRRLTYGAAPISESLLARVIECLPAVGLINSYGLTEACANICANPPTSHDERGRQSGLYRSVGRCGPAVQVKVVDGNGVEVPRGTVGEIIVRGPNMSPGYWNRPAETAEALRDGWFHTGDGAYMDEAGYLFLVDRIKDMIVSGGENVYSAEVENAIARHPAVAACAVIGVPHEKWGEAVHAVVVLKPGHTADADMIRTHCRQFVAGYKCPKTVAFRPALPLSAAGKVLKRELRLEYRAA